MKTEILSLLPPGHPWGQHLHWLDTIDSTNTYAKALARQGAPAGTTVIAGAQTGGRGRLGRSFVSPAGLGVYLSVILRPDCRPEDLLHLTCAAGVAAADAVQAVSSLRPGIKWTNDLVLNKRKLGGILTELAISPQTGLVDFAIVGIGINCRQTLRDFPADISSIACSLAMEGFDISPAHLSAELIRQLQQMNDRLFSEKIPIMAQFSSDCVTIGCDISILSPLDVRHGRAVGIDENGGLEVVLTDGTRETVTSGEVSIRGMYGYL